MHIILYNTMEITLKQMMLSIAHDHQCEMKYGNGGFMIAATWEGCT